MTKGGFFIIEFMVYFILFSFLSLLLMQFIVSSTVKLKERSKRLNQKVELYAALDAMTSLLETAPLKKNAWEKMDADILIWKQDRDNDFSLRFDNNKVYFVKGSYDEKNRIWRKYRKNLLLNNVESISFVTHEFREEEPCSLVITIAVSIEGIRKEKTVSVQGARA